MELKIFSLLKIALLCCLIKPITSMCQMPDYPKNGFYSLDKLSYSMGESITYSCAAGYDLLGQPTRTCLASGLWDKLTPFCDKPIQLSMPSWTSDKMVDGNKDTCHPIIHGMTFTLKNPGIVQAVRVHIPSQPPTKIAVFTIQDKNVKLCNDYETKTNTEEWVVVQCENAGAMANRIRVMHIGDEENKIEICEISAYVHTGEWCLFPPQYPVQSGRFEVGRDTAILHCQRGVKERLGFMMCRNNTWTGADLYCEKPTTTSPATAPLFAAPEASVQDCSHHYSNKVNMLVAVVIILIFSLLGLTMYEIWRNKRCSRMMSMKPSWSRMNSEECNI